MGQWGRGGEVPKPQPPPRLSTNTRGIKWSLRAFVSMRAVRLFLRAQAVINFLMRAASTL